MSAPTPSVALCGNRDVSVPFRKHLYDRAVAIQHRLTTVDVLEDRYTELARGVTLRLPVFLALALRDARAPDDLWDALAQLRQRAAACRERREEIDAALARSDLHEAAKVAKALRTDADHVIATVGHATAAATFAAVQEIARGDVVGIATGIAAAEAAGKKLLSSSVADRLMWRLQRPYLLWLDDLDDIVDEARHITEALPDFAQIWAIPENRQEIFASRFAAMAALQQ